MNNEIPITDPNGRTIETRWAPKGLVTINANPGSFEHRLGHLPLRPHGSEVRLYNGQVKSGMGGTWQWSTSL